MSLNFIKIPILQGLWDQWEAAPYKIVSYAVGEFYAYYHNYNVCTPPHSVECPGCGDPTCTGFHQAWGSYRTAEADCEAHASKRERHE